MKRVQREMQVCHELRTYMHLLSLCQICLVYMYFVSSILLYFTCMFRPQTAQWWNHRIQARKLFLSVCKCSTNDLLCYWRIHYLYQCIYQCMTLGTRNFISLHVPWHSWLGSVHVVCLGISNNMLQCPDTGQLYTHPYICSNVCVCGSLCTEQI